MHMPQGRPAGTRPLPPLKQTWPRPLLIFLKKHVANPIYNASIRFCCFRLNHREIHKMINKKRSILRVSPRGRNTTCLNKRRVIIFVFQSLSQTSLVEFFLVTRNKGTRVTFEHVHSCLVQSRAGYRLRCFCR